LWTLAINQVLQPGLQAPLRNAVTADDIRRAYANAGLSATDDEIARMVRQVGQRS
jgi:hypothetical protein